MKKQHQRKTSPIDQHAHLFRVNDHQACFEFDRRLVVAQIEFMRAASRSNADELEMIASERVFELSISKEFLRMANQFVMLMQKLAYLRDIAIQAKGYPTE